MSKPGAVQPSKPIQLYTAATPNGYKISILLEELKDKYPDFTYETHSLSFDKNEQKAPGFLKINPNGRIPAIVDPNRNDFPVFDTLAILQYLVIHYDPEGHFHFRGQPDEESEVIQWMAFTASGIGPMQGQLNHFARYAPEKIQYGIDRYHKETLRLYKVVDDKLQDREYIVGPGKGKYSIADINMYPWVQMFFYAGIQRSEMPKNLLAWCDRIYERKPTQAGLDVPTHNKAYDMCRDPECDSKFADEIEKMSDKHKKWIQEGNK